jgi:hypothetical protein
MLGISTRGFVDSQCELIHDDAESTQVGVGPVPRDDVEETADSTDVQCDESFDVRTQDLHDDVAALITRTIHLAERAGGEGLPIEGVEHFLGSAAVCGYDLLLDLVEWNNGDAVNQRAQRGEVGFGNDVRTRCEDLGKLNKRRAEVCQRADESGGATCMKGVVSLERGACHNPTPEVAPERADEREEAPGDCQRSTVWQATRFFVRDGRGRTERC